MESKKIEINFPTEYNLVNTQTGNIDVNIIFNEKVYCITFFTIKNIDTLMLKKEFSEYFWASDMIIIKDLELQTIKQVTKNLLLEGLLDNFLNIGSRKKVFGDPPEYGEIIEFEFF